MKLSELRAKGAFVPSELVKRTVNWTTPEGEQVTFDVHIKRLSYGDFERVILDGDDDRSKGAGLIAATVSLGDDGKEPIPYIDAYRLERGLAAALIAASSEVNKAPAADPKP